MKASEYFRTKTLSEIELTPMSVWRYAALMSSNEPSVLIMIITIYYYYYYYYYNNYYYYILLLMGSRQSTAVYKIS